MPASILMQTVTDFRITFCTAKFLSLVLKASKETRKLLILEKEVSEERPLAQGSGSTNVT